MTDLFLKVFDLPPLYLRLVLQVTDPLQRLKGQRQKKEEAVGNIYLTNNKPSLQCASNAGGSSKLVP